MKYLILILAITSYPAVSLADANYASVCRTSCKNLAKENETPYCEFSCKLTASTGEDIAIDDFVVNDQEAEHLVLRCEEQLKIKYEAEDKKLVDAKKVNDDKNKVTAGLPEKTCDVSLSNNLYVICNKAAGEQLAAKVEAKESELLKICDSGTACGENGKDCPKVQATVKDYKTRCDILTKMYSTDKFNISSSSSDKEVRAADPQMGGATCDKGEKKASSDFQSCKKLVNSINASYATAMATQVGGQVNTAVTQVKIQKDLKEDDGKTHTKLMDAAKDNLTTAKNNAWAEEGVYLGSASLIGGIIANYPTPKAAAKWCRGLDGYTDTLCNEVFNDSSVRAAAFNNQDVLDNAKTVLTSAIAKAAVKGAEIWALQKQLDNLSEVEEGFKKLDETANGPNFADLQVSKCQMNPQAPECQQNGEYIGPPSIGSLNFGDGANGVIDPNQVGGTDFNGGGNSTAGNTTSNADGSDLGPLAIGGKSSSNGLMGSFSAPGLKPFNYAAGGTGGGGGGGGGGAGGGKSGGAGSDGSGKMNIGASGLQFSGPGSFTIGGKKGKGGDENPFDKLIKKDEKSDGDMDFRAPASAEDASKGIFVRISERYQKVNQAKKLLEYETK